MTRLVGVLWLTDAARGVREAFFMFWETLWALVLGLTLSGVVQVFVPRESMQRGLGDHRAGALVRASGYGMASSSCSYAAAAVARSLFQKGADLVSALAFMFASTNLVLELGLVILALLGWQFAAAEFVGGPIMISLLALGGGVVLRGALVARARARPAGGAAGGHDHQPTAPPSGEGEDFARLAWSRKLRSVPAWSEASDRAVADATMLRKELVFGFLAAGFLAVLVPASAWDALFLPGHGAWTSVENAFVGPLIAVISCVCSIGNVPLAAALWQGGTSFGGVISFIFADLIALPMILVYRKYYGSRLALRMAVLFYLVMAVAGLAVGGLFDLLGAVPAHRAVKIVPSHISWDVTTVLNLVFAVVAGFVYRLHRRSRSPRLSNAA